MTAVRENPRDFHFPAWGMPDNLRSGPWGLRGSACRALLTAALLTQIAAAATTARGSVEYLRTTPSVREFTKPRGFFSKLLNWVAGPPDDRPEIVRPYGTTHDSTGRLLIADPGQRGVHIFDFEKRKYQFLKGPKNAVFASPIDVACDTNDDIYVSDSSRAQVYVFDVRGRYLRSFGGVGDGRMQRPTGMALDRKTRQVFLTDTLRHQVMVFGLDGSLRRVIGKRGEGPGEFNFPTALTLSAGKLYVVDSMNFRIQTLTTEGAYLSAFGKIGNHTGSLNRPKGIAADTDGNLYLVDALFETVQVFDPQGGLLYYFGSSGAKPGQFQLPTGISIDDRNIIYVADSLNSRVQVFRYRRQAE
jgi:DNA-binding beta-propeller fold protein YncE